MTRKLRPSVVLFLVAAAGASAQDHPATMTREQLAAAAAGAWGNISTISVTCTNTMPNETAENVIRSRHAAMTLKGDKVFLDNTLCGCAANDNTTTERIIAFDGVRSAVQLGDPYPAAIVQAGRSSEADPHAAEFFDHCMLMSAGGTWPEDQTDTLVGYLRDPAVHVRAALEEVNGHWCYVADQPRPTGAGNRMTIWIDPDRGFLPVRQRHFTGPAGDTVLLELHVEQAIQLPTGHWVPVRAVKRSGVVPGTADLQVPHETVMQVDQDAQGAYLVTVNAPVDDSLFTLADRLPAGMRVLDQDTHQSWIAGRDVKAPKTAVAAADTPANRPDPAAAVPLIVSKP